MPVGHHADEDLLAVAGLEQDAPRLAIARQYLIPKQLDAHGLKPDRLAFDPKAVVEIIRGHTSEAGLRRLEQLIGQVCRKVAKSVDVLRNDQERTKELEEVRKNAEDALKEVEKLKQEFSDEYSRQQ